MIDINGLIKHVEENKDWRMDTVTLGNFKYGNYTFHATYFIDCSLGKFQFPVFVTFPERIRKTDKRMEELWKMACSVQLANLFIFSKQEEIDLSFLSKRGELFIRDMISNSVTHLEDKFPGYFTHKKKEWVEYQQLPASEYKISMNKKFSVLMSGGKESSGVYQMYYDLGRKPGSSLSGVFVDFVGKIVRRENNQMIKKLTALGHRPIVIASNIIDPLMLISTEWGCNNLFINIITFPAAIYCLNRGIHYFNMGNEFDCTVCKIIDGHETFGQNYDQTTVNERKVSQFLKDIDVDVKLFSPVYHQVETACQALFTWNDTLGLTDAQNSCVEPILKDGEYIACDKCDKCWRIATIMKALNIDCEKYGLTYTQKVWSQKEDIFNSLDSTKESQTVAYLLDRQGLFPGEISNIKPKFNFSTLDFEYDKFHPFILPPEMYKYISDTMKRVRRDLNVE